jgi:hypothetical protein
LKTAIIQGSNLASFCVEKFGTERMVELERKRSEKSIETIQSFNTI